MYFKEYHSFFHIICALILSFVILLSGAIFPSPSEGLSAREFALRNRCTIDASALDLLDSLGELTYLDSAFILRIAPLTAAQQRAYALKLASDGHLTVQKLKQVPFAVAVPSDPGDIIPILYELLREDYWRGWLKRHSFAASVKMTEWHDTAERRFVDPGLAKQLIDIFFQKRNGKYRGSGIVYLNHGK